LPYLDESTVARKAGSHDDTVGETHGLHAS
jgi:hypothetical protein